MTTCRTDHPFVLETGRLLLRELTPDDADFISLLLNTPGWLQYIGDRNVRSREQAVAFLENGPLKSYRERGFGMYLVETKAGRQPAGVCGILKRPDLGTPDLGFAFLPEFTGHGYAYESARATLDYAREQLLIRKISAIVLPENSRSIRLLEKLGLRQTGQYVPPTGEKLLLFTTALL